MKWLNHLLDLIYPRSCEACGESLLGDENLICTTCMINLPRTNSHFEKNGSLEKRFWGKVQVKNVYSYLTFSKKGKVQKLLHGIKYRNKPELARELGRLYGSELKLERINENLDLIIGVPLHEQRFKDRGYNQADCIAEGLSEALNTPFETEIVIRKENTTTQTKKTRIERFKNVEKIFEVREKGKVEGKRIAIVDDVLTTGSTLESLGIELLENGAKEITIITLANAK